jgi:hypothetical protein
MTAENEKRPVPISTIGDREATRVEREPLNGICAFRNRIRTPIPPGGPSTRASVVCYRKRLKPTSETS